MDWGALLDAAKNNPEIKALVSKLSGSAGEAAPAVERDVTESIPKLKSSATPEAAPVAIEGAGAPPLEPPVDQSTWISDVPEEEPTSSPMSMKQKAALAAGVGAAGLGAAKLLQKDDDNNNEEAPPEATSPPAPVAATTSRAPTGEEDIDENANTEAVDDTTDKIHGADTYGHPETLDPKEAQLRQAISKILNFGQQSSEGPNALERAIQQRNENLRGNDIAEGFARMGAGIARVKPDLEVYEKHRQEANLPLQDLEARNKFEANDPKSGLSQGMRDYAKTLGLQVSEGTSASQLQQVLPMVWKDIEAKQAQAARSADLQNRLQIAQMNKEAQMANAKAYKDLARQDKLTKQGQDQYNKGLQQAQSVRGNKAIQNDMETLRRVQNAMSTIKQYPDPNKIPAPVLNMFDADLATIMMGGAPGEGVMKEVADPSIQKDLAQFWSKWSNQPQGARAAAFVQQKSKIFNTLANDAQDRIDKRFKGIGNTMGMNWSPEQKEAFRAEYLPNYVINGAGQYAKPEHLTDDEIKQQWLKLQQQKAGANGGQ